MSDPPLNKEVFRSIVILVEVAELKVGSWGASGDVPAVI